MLHKGASDCAASSLAHSTLLFLEPRHVVVAAIELLKDGHALTLTIIKGLEEILGEGSYLNRVL